jgi:hypothetical protein
MLELSHWLHANGYLVKKLFDVIFDLGENFLILYPRVGSVLSLSNLLKYRN